MAHATPTTHIPTHVVPNCHQLEQAWGYRNQVGVGKALADFGVKKDDIFITSKVRRCKLTLA